MNELVIMHDQQAVTTSLRVAESFSKAHRNVLASIKKITAENSAVKNMFAESTYVNRRGQEQREEVRKIVKEEIKKANMQSMSASKVAEIAEKEIERVLKEFGNEFGTIY